MNFFLLTTIIVLSNAAHASCGKKMSVAHQVQPTAKTGGPTSLAMVMTYLGKSTTGTDVCTYLGTCDSSSGTDFIQMLDAAQHYGFSSAVWKYGVSELQTSIANGVPVVAIINVEAGSYPKLSDGSAAYASFTGGAYIEIHGIHCDADGNIDYFYVNDPSQSGWKDRQYSYESMKTAWGNRDYRYLEVQAKGPSGTTDSSSSAPAPEPTPEPTPTPSDSKTKKLNVAHLTQPTSTSGGPTCLAMAMNYYGKKYTGKDVCTYLGNCDSSAGTGFDELLSAAKHYGFSKASWQYGTSLFKKAIDQNVTCVAIINAQSGSYPKMTNGTALSGISGGHYIEIHGYHLDADGNIDYYIANDPYKNGWKDLQFTAASMKTAWGDRDYRFLALKSFTGAADNSDGGSSNNNDGGSVPDTSKCTVKMSVAHQKQPTSYSCGPTSLAMAMNYYGHSYTGKQICNWIGNCYRTSGTDFGEMSAAARHYGFSGAVWKSGVSSYKTAIKKGITTVAIIRVVAGSYPRKTDGGAAFQSFTGGHYIEMHGYHCDSSGNIDYFYCNDPAQSGWKDRQYTYSSMKSAWGNRSYQFLALKSY